MHAVFNFDCSADEFRSYIASETESDMHLHEKQYGYVFPDGVTSDDLNARNILVAAMKLRTIPSVDNGRQSAFALKSLGFKFACNRKGFSIFAGIPEDVNEHDKIHGVMFLPIDSVVYKRWLRTTIDNASVPGWFLPVPNNIEEIADEKPLRMVILEDYRNTVDSKLWNKQCSGHLGILVVYSFWHTYSDAVFKQIANDAFDILATLHLADARAFVSQGNEYFSYYSPISATWKYMLEQSREGRVGVCDYCGKPYISKKERGKKRRFCSQLCSKRFQRHPNPAFCNTH